MENYQTDLVLTEIWIYPVKSLAGISCIEAEAQIRGLEYDRRWMIVDVNNCFLTQREFPEMALIQPQLSIESGKLTAIIFTHKLKNNEYYRLENPELHTGKNIEIEVEVWDDKVKAQEINDGVNDWLSKIIGKKCKLVYMSEDINRKVDSNYAITGNEITSFSDAYPYLIIGQEALDLLNSKLEHKLNMLRFRPNLVFSGGAPHDEDNWLRFTIGNVEMAGVKKCARCPIPTIDQNNASTGKEPLKTLATYRFQNNKVYFGQNVLIEKTGKIKIGDEINVKSKID
jgi:uncharacterized protein